MTNTATGERKRHVPNILTDRLPHTAAGYELDTDFTSWIIYEEILHDDDLTPEEKIREILLAVIRDPETLKPEDLDAVMTDIIRFHTVGAYDPKERRQSNRKRQDEAYDFYIDRELILAAFMQAYGINLAEAHMHWWIFHALLVGLPDSTTFSKIMGYRVCDTSNMPKQTREEYNRLKARFAIKRKRQKPRTKAEAEADMLAQVDALFARAEQAVREAKQTGGTTDG